MTDTRNDESVPSAYKVLPATPTNCNLIPIKTTYSRHEAKKDRTNNRHGNSIPNTDTINCATIACYASYVATESIVTTTDSRGNNTFSVASKLISAATIPHRVTTPNG